MLIPISLTEDYMSESRETKTILLDHGNPGKKREEIREYFHKTFSSDEKLYESLRFEKTFFLRADQLRHPLIFYLGHTAAFYINKLILTKVIKERINPDFESMFAIGVDEMSWDDLNEAHYNWPSIADVRIYRDQVRAKVDSIISSLPVELPITWDNPFWVIMMGIEHQRIHLETSSVLIRQLPVDQLQTLPVWEICQESGKAPSNELLLLKGGKVISGKQRNHPLYGWDNEYGYQETELRDFEVAKYLVSNQEFLDFVNDNGYEEKKWWTDEGWGWVAFKKAKFPLFWIKRDNDFFLRTMTQVIPMPWDWPVEINYLEAKAFCNWKSGKTGKNLRLPTEDEWNHLRNSCNVEDQPYWSKAPGNINLEYFASSCPVNKFSFGEFFDVIGNVWQWTETPIYGFKGFRVHPAYDDFSTPTFDSRHNLIKGGSWISTGNEATIHSRYAFRRHFYQHAGFRYVESDNPVIVHDDSYETDFEVVMECDKHYGNDHLGLGNFQKNIVDYCIRICSPDKRDRALNLGCSVGRTAFELARHFNFVTGLDFSARFIKNAVRMQEKSDLHYAMKNEGEIVSFYDKYLQDYQLTEFADKVVFLQTDAANMKAIFSDYDFVLADDIIDKIYDPVSFLKLIRDRINKSGLLVITSAFDWNEEKTQKEKWLGGYKEAGDNVNGITGIERLLSADFIKINEPYEMYSVFRETVRKYCVRKMQVMVWQKR